MDNIDQYDMINAPQFLDFVALVENGGGYDDPETDKYFETHREEDDFFIPIENLQPTIQLLSEQSNVNKTPTAVEIVEKGDIENMEDVSVEYYNTPNGKQSSITNGELSLKKSCDNTRSESPAGKIMKISLTPSFHTPVGEEEDKENYNYSPHSHSSTFLSTADKTLVASNCRTTGSTSGADFTDGDASKYYLRESLLAQLEKLNVVDVEQDPVEATSQNKINQGYSPFNYQKGNCWNTNEKNLTPTLVNTTLVVDTPPESPQEVQIYSAQETPKLGTPVNPKLVDGKESEIRPRSIYIHPSVGSEVVWVNKSEEELANEYLDKEDDDEDIDKVNSFHRSENCLASLVSLETDITPCMVELSPVKNLRRVSSLSDISKFLVPKNRKSTTVYGFNPRAGITIPKTPDTAKRRSGRSRLARTSSNCSSQSSISSSIVSSISSASKIPLIKPNLTFGFGRKMGPVSGGDRAGITTFRSNLVARERKPLPTSNYVPFAQAVASFQKNTPTRYRSAPRGCVLPKRSTSVDTVKRRPSPVSPHSPNLMTKQRARQTLAGAQNEANKEETKVSEKAQQPPTQKLLRGMLTLPKKIELRTTKPQPFNLTEHTRPKPVKEETTEWKFRARPAPVKILHGPIGVKERPQIKPTAPVELHFASEDRIRERQQKRSAQSKEPSPVRQIVPPKISRIPPRRAPSPIRPVEHRTTTVQPFSFEQRDKEMKQKKAEKLRQEEQEIKKQREFHANPLPSFNNKLPKKKPAEPTHVEPFRFKSDERGAAHQAAFRQKLDEEERNHREQQKFQANPAIVVKKKPFEPAKSSRPLVEPLDIQLNSDVRAQEREKYDEAIKQKEQEIEERRQQEEAAREHREREVELEMRQQLVHKAKPFKNLRIFEVKASDKPLVDPKSPDFAPLPSQRRPKRDN